MAGAARERAAGFLLWYLRDDLRAAAEIRFAADELGLAWRTLRRAADDLGVQRRKQAWGRDGFWTWALPDDLLDPDRPPPPELRPARGLCDCERTFPGDGACLNCGKSVLPDAKPYRAPTQARPGRIVVWGDL